MIWWANLPLPPSNEDEMVNVTAPFLSDVLSQEKIDALEEATFREICMAVHAIKDYARRVRNRSVGLPDDGRQYTIPQQVDSLSHALWTDECAGDHDVKDVLSCTLYARADNERTKSV